MILVASSTTVPKHRRLSRGGAEGAVAPTCRQGGQTVSNVPPPFRRLSGMMPTSTKKHRHYIGENV